MKLTLMATLIFYSTAFANENGAEFKCENDRPVLTFTATTKDAGKPGLLWIGVHTPDKKFGYFLNLNGVWEQYTGGLYPPNKRFDGGLPERARMRVPLPSQANGADSTAAFAGWEIYVGYGALTKADEEVIKTRRKAIQDARKSGQKLDHPEYDSDERLAWALVQKNMVDNQKYRRVIVVPNMSCAEKSARIPTAAKGEKP